MNFMRALAAQRVSISPWFELQDLPFAPSYKFNEAMTEVTLNTTLHEHWWPKALAVTNSRHWRMPFSNRVKSSVPHHLPTNVTWAFIGSTGKPEPVPIFQAGTNNGTLNPEFERLFLVLFRVLFRVLFPVCSSLCFCRVLFCLDPCAIHCGTDGRSQGDCQRSSTPQPPAGRRRVYSREV